MPISSGMQRAGFVNGDVFIKMRSATALYKQSLNRLRNSNIDVISSELNDCLLAKDCNTFWKCLKNKFGMSNSSSTHAVNGNTDNALIAESFADYFSRVCTPNCAVQNTKLYDIFVRKFEHYVGADMAVDVNSQTVHEIISKLRPGKAPSGDGIMNMYSYYLTYTCKAL